LAIVTALALWQLRTGTRSAVALPVYGAVPPFALVERDGRPVSAADLAGHVWVASFVFTRCGGMCPGLTTTMAALMRRLHTAADDGVRAVTFTVDPAHDDPATLQRYAQQYGADPVRWLFLTGEPVAVEHLVRDGFRLSIAELPPGEREQSSEPITHSDRFVLVDRDLRIRGYYHGTDPESVAQLQTDLQLLAGSR
jgi:cytochrome oxidase Cu insertion factor (SCO1/SenC/PrrC family)